MCGCATSRRSGSGTSAEEVPGSDLRFTRQLRLRSSIAFREAFGGRQFVGSHMVLWVRRRESTEPSRLGVVASKRTFPKAVMRNRAKRLLREAFRLEQHSLAPGMDLVIVGRRRLLSAHIDDVRREFRWILGKADLRRQVSGGGSGGCG